MIAHVWTEEVSPECAYVKCVSSCFISSKGDTYYRVFELPKWKVENLENAGFDYRKHIEAIHEACIGKVE